MFVGVCVQGFTGITWVQEAFCWNCQKMGENIMQYFGDYTNCQQQKKVWKYSAVLYGFSTKID